MCGGQQPVVVSKAPHQLQANRHARAAARKRQGDAGQSEQRPTTAKQGVTGGRQPGRRFTNGARRQQHVEIAELTRLTRLGMFNLDVWQMKNKPSNHQLGLVHVIFNTWLYSMKALHQSACANLISEESVVPLALHPAPKEQPPRKLSGKRTDIVIDL
jgi:hypothetical protein